MEQLSLDIWTALNIFVSASLYLFDFATNILTASQYYLLENQPHPIYHNPTLGNRPLTGIFPAILILIVAAHILNAVIFWSTLPPEEQPIKQAYFLPLIQLWRLAKLVWLTTTCQGVRSLNTEVKPLYNIVAAALETGAELLLQLFVFIVLPPSNRLALSIVAAFLSASYNGGVAIVSVTEKATFAGRVGIGIAGGIYVYSALLLRSLSFALSSGYVKGNYSFILLLCLGLIVNFVPLWFMANRGDFSWIRCIAFSYMGMTVGPLYPLLNQEQRNKGRQVDSKRVRKLKFGLVFCAASATHLVLDMSILGVGYRASMQDKHYTWQEEVACRDTAGTCDYYLKPSLATLREPYWLFYPGRMHKMYLPRFVYGALLFVLSAIGFLTVYACAKDEEAKMISLVKDSFTNEVKEGEIL